MTALVDLADDILVDTLLMQITALLKRLIDHGEAGSIDLRGVPLSAGCIADLQQRLGHGEITVRVEAAGLSDIHETSFPGVWWTSHADEAGRVVALLIEVAVTPAILLADHGEMLGGLLRLPAATHVAAHARNWRG